AAAAIGAARRQAAAEREAVERRKGERDLATARATRLVAVAKRGDSAWREVEDLIALRNSVGYDQAAALLADLGEVAATADAQERFTRRLADLRTRHDRKGKFIERLDKAGLR
ncbi:MAG: hypothetical protein HQL41_08735, partial [Alphaproteobacteria bacterium]|nr:hypothetical protein [Alphaproteobacteria bacterium]